MQEAPQARCPWSILAWPLCPRYLRDCALLRLARAPSVGSLNAWGYDPPPPVLLPLSRVADLSAVSLASRQSTKQANQRSGAHGPFA
ncbi:hypothetical protein PUN4_830078 [Paraburkholderia unamae]|nr:hypothetical protein PUN4_830078 [Paraburkholderia unamae]